MAKSQKDEKITKKGETKQQLKFHCLRGEKRGKIFAPQAQKFLTFDHLILVGEALATFAEHGSNVINGEFWSMLLTKPFGRAV